MIREVDYVIIGAGIAGMTLDHMLRDQSRVLIDPSPGKYKIGESIIPQHFAEPEVRPLFEIVKKLPSYTPKDGTLFIEDTTVGGFEPFPESNFTVHVARQELEEATAKFFGTRIVRERVESIDVETRTVVTDAGTFRANKLILDCSGPARILARTLGISREVWPVWASWAYHDILDVDEERFFAILRRGEKQFYRYDERNRVLRESSDYSGFRPSWCTNLTRVKDGTWTWQIPLWGAKRLSVGVVSREGPVSEEQYREVTGRAISPQFRTEMRPWDTSGPFNAFHVRNRFAWAADTFAGDTWALVGDAAFFGDPVYSVGTGFSTNHAIQLGRILLQGEWDARRADAHQRQTAHLFGRAKKAYDCWYFGRVVAEKGVADEIQADFLNGRAFQVQTIRAYDDMWLVSHPQDTRNDLSPRLGEDVTDRVQSFLGETQTVVGWRLQTARLRQNRLDLTWERPDNAPLVLRVERLAVHQPAFRRIGDLGLSYEAPRKQQGRLDGQSSALVEGFAELVRVESDRISALLSNAVH